MELWGLLVLLSVLPGLDAQLQSANVDVSSCTCGFYDDASNSVYTDTSIVYFNETDVIPEDYVVESYEHRFDRGWNVLYREGAAEDNVAVTNDSTARNLTSLAMYCNPSDENHLVVGSSIRTKRQDVFFGSFRASMRAPRQWFLGSALSMVLDHNQTESWDMDIMNTNNGSWAWVSMLAQGQFSNLWLGTNFTDLIAAGLDPWYYVEYRVDWNRTGIYYYIGGDLQLNFTREMNGTVPSTPAPLRFKHWSTGNIYNTQGPPAHQSEANVAWTRLFFNSSLTTNEQHDEFNKRCLPADACLMNDNTLRGSTEYPAEAVKPWKQHHPKWTIPWIPLIIDVLFASVFTVLVTKTLWRRNWPSLRKSLPIAEKSPEGSPSSPASASSKYSSDHASNHSSYVGSTDSDTRAETATVIGSEHSRNASLSGPLQRDTSYASFETPPNYSGTNTPAPGYQSQWQTPYASGRTTRVNSQDDLTIQTIPEAGYVQAGRNPNRPYQAGRNGPPRIQTRGYPNNPLYNRSQSNPFLPPPSGPSTPAPEAIPAMPVTPGALSPSPSTPSLAHGSPELLIRDAPPVPPVPAREENKVEEKKTNDPAIAKEAAAKPDASGKLPPAKRVDYLAGFIAMSALLVTLNHFGLTFWAAVIIPSTDPHYQSEIWARKTIASYFLDPLWIGPFLMISTRFLVSNYLRTGNLGNMAQKIVVRPFRLLTPVASIAFLEYFLMDSGAITWLEYLPSVTWSSWPYTAIVANPGIYISELIQLAFLIPNAAPMITYNYCTGVLWTIPIQLQGAWQTLLALIMISEVKTPWKRFCFYTFCIVNHWYGLSWGSYYYAGVLLADLDLTFKYTKWLHARPFVYYPLLWFLIALALGGFTIDMVVQWTGVNYATYEYGIHPDAATGLPIVQAEAVPYPDYFIPRLNALLTTVSMQAVVEICPTLQKILSVKVLQWIFPHIFTIYLIHGFVFWSIGSWAMVSFWSYHLPYWLCVLLTAIVCYGSLFASLPILTPPIEMVGKNFTQALWEHASQEPVPRRPTTWPFDMDLLRGRDVGGANEAPSETSSISMNKTAIEEKDWMYGKEKGKEKEMDGMRVNENGALGKAVVN